MGLFDGEPSSADLARELGLPVALVIDASAMAQTFGAIAHGLSHYDPALRVIGVFAQRVAGAAHRQMLEESLRDTRFLGAAPSLPDTALPERHLGLVMPWELNDFALRVDRATACLAGEPIVHALPEAVLAAPEPRVIRRSLTGVRVGVAHDRAFCFVYPENVDVLKALGATVLTFSPCDDRTLPDVDALYFPGGYPELHAEPLARNTGMRASVAAHVERGRPVLAECGGLMYLSRAIVGLDGVRHPMIGALALEAHMGERLRAIGHHHGEFAAGVLRGHTFHYSEMRGDEPASAYSAPERWGRPEAVYVRGRVVASYVHWYFASQPQVVSALFFP
jgi:cobyrinic acid a,c-diamide synthase